MNSFFALVRLLKTLNVGSSDPSDTFGAIQGGCCTPQLVDVDDAIRALLRPVLNGAAANLRGTFEV